MIIYNNQAALAITNIFLNKGKNEELLKYAKSKIRIRKDVITEMRMFMQEEPNKGSVDSTKFREAANKMLSNMISASNNLSGSIDMQFIQSIMLLHEAAIDMSEAEIRHGSHQTLKIHARNIKAVENEEIGWIRHWLNNNEIN